MKTYTREQALASTLEYFEGDTLAADVFLKKYALKNDKGEYLESNPDHLHRRLSKEFARIEAKYPNPMSDEEIYGLLANFGYVVAQGSPMSGIGNDRQVQSLSNCFVIPSPYDSYGGILFTDQQQAQIMKRRGGVGFDISTIRPQGLPTANAASTTDGIGVFMERFSNTCREVAQGGRRGALMLSVSVHHPEIRTFINIKRDKNKVTGANVSIRLSDEFMNAVKRGEKVQLRFPVETNVEHSIEEMVDAKQLWDEIISAAHFRAEPGLLFWDRILKMGPADAYILEGFLSISTNPCGEITLSAYDSCRLLLLNLYSFVRSKFTESASFDFELYEKIVEKAQRLMDDLVDLEIEMVDKILAKIDADPEPEHIKEIEKNLWTKIRNVAVLGRRTGLGITALGDTLASLNIRYGSDESVTMTDKIYRSLALGSYRSSVQMAKERGTFPAFSHLVEKDHPFIERILAEDSELRSDYNKYGRRNIANTTTAPAGSVSTQTQTTSGIENVFMLMYDRFRKLMEDDHDTPVDRIDEQGDRWHKYTVYHHAFKEWMQVTGKSDPVESPWHMATSRDVDWIAKVSVQAAAQKWICHSISNTTNVPNDTPESVIADIYMKGWELGCKGITVYRDGCRDGVLTAVDVDTGDVLFGTHHAPKRPEKLPCSIHQVNIRGEAWTIFVGLLEDKPYEVMGGLSKYVNIPKKIKTGVIIKRKLKKDEAKYDLQYGDEDDPSLIKDITSVFENSTHASFTRVISLALRHGSPVQYVVEQLQKGDKDSDMFSFSRVIARVLKSYIPSGTKVTSEKSCADCGSESLVYQEGCVRCVSCGSSKCG